MALPGGLSGTFYLGLILLGLGTLFHLIGMATPKWSVSESENHNLGLFKTCYLEICGEYLKKSSTLEACEAFAVMGILGGIGATVVSVLILLLAITNKDRQRVLSLLLVFSSIGAFLAILICVIIYGTTIHEDISFLYKVGYSYILSIIGGAFIPVGGFLVYLATK